MHDILTHGDCLDVLRSMPDNSVDSIVTDPPYGIKFMGKTWDYDVPSLAIWEECLRVIKPGGHLMSFAGSRTQHRMAARIEDAGFKIRDMIVFLYETNNAARVLIESLSSDQLKLLDATFGRDGMLGWVYGSGFPKSHHALKPALEPITLARKPFRGSMASNVCVHGIGVLNIKECRIPLAKGESSYDYPNGPGGSDPNHMWRGRSKGDVMGVWQGKEALMVAGLPILSMMAVMQCLPGSGITLSRQKLAAPVGSFIARKPIKKTLVRRTIICV